MPANQRILIIEDETKFKSLCRIRIKAYEGYETKACSDGRSGLQAQMMTVGCYFIRI